MEEFAEQVVQRLEELLGRKIEVQYPWELFDKLEKIIFIGENSSVEGKLRNTVIIGKNCKIGASSEIKNSIIMDYSNAPHHNYIGDSIIGRNCNLGAGTKIANFRLDGKNITIEVEGKRYETGRRKLGAIIEDEVKTGCNVVINPGSYIGKNSYIGPGVVIFGYVPPNSRIKQNYYS